MQALKMRGKRQSSQGCKNFPADFVRSAKFQWLLAPHWTMARLFLMIAAWASRILCLSLWKRRGSARGIFDGRVERRIVFGHVFFIFSSIYLAMLEKINDLQRFVAKTCLNIRKYQTIFEYSLDHHFFSYLRQYGSSQQQAELYLFESWWSTTGQLWGRKCVFQTRKTLATSNHVYIMYEYTIYYWYKYFIDLFWITADSPTLFSESEDFDTWLWWFPRILHRHGEAEEFVPRNHTRHGLALMMAGGLVNVHLPTRPLEFWKNGKHLMYISS